MFLFLLFFFLGVPAISGSFQIGFIKNTSISTNTTFIPSQDSKCFDCLCDCLYNKIQNYSRKTPCYGINCFPSNRTCQHIEQLWIQETDLVSVNTSDQFIITHSINFCSCYSPQNLLNQYTNVTPITISHSLARYVLYNPYDNTLIVLGDNLIGQYYVSNLTRFRSLSVTDTPLAVVTNSNSIYIAFNGNMSVNKYDMNLKFNRTVSIPATSRSSSCYGLVLWKNGLFVTDDAKNSIWFIDSTTMNISLYLNLINYSIEPFSIAVYNDNLYISQLSSPIIYIYDLVYKSMRSLTFPNSIALYRLGMDPYCNRLWFGTQTTTFNSVPVIDLASDNPAVYRAKGVLTTGPTYKIEFDSNYSMYTVAVNGNSFYKYPMSAIFCDKN